MDPLSFGLTLPALPASVSVVRHLFGGTRGIWPVPDLLLDDIQIAVSEACTNVVQHAYDDAAPGILEVHAAVERDAVVVRVRDNGPGVGTTPPAAPGVGMMLIAALTTHLDVGHQEDGAHQVCMVFALPAAETA